MIPPHDHDRDDDLRPDPFIEVTRGGRIKKKRRRRRGIYLPTNQPSQHPSVAQPPTHRQPQRPQTRPQPPRAPRDKRRRSVPFTFLIFVITFLVLRNIDGIIGFFQPDPAPKYSPNSSGLVFLEPGQAVRTERFEIAVDDLTLDTGTHFAEPDPESFAYQEGAEYLAFAITITNTGSFETSFAPSTGWSDGVETPLTNRAINCQLQEKGGDYTLSLTLAHEESGTLHRCVQLPEDLDPDDPGYIYADPSDGTDAKLLWKIPTEVFN